MIIRLNPASVDYGNDPIIEDQGQVIGTESDLDVIRRGEQE